MSKPAESDLQHVAESVSMPNPVDLSFLIHTIPDIPRDASIIGLCTIPKSLADPEAQGWHLSAFAAWKTLLGKAFPQNPQAWLSAVDGWFCSPLVFGGKRVNEAFDVKDVKIIEDPKNLAVEFLLEIEQKVAVAAGKKPIVVIICGPTSLGQDIPIGLDVAADQRATVTIKQIKQSSKGAKQLMLVTPSMLAATWWLVNPHLNQTASTAAASHIPPNTGKTPIVTVNLVKMYARRCTLLFMDQLISDVFSGKTLFLHPKYEYEDGANSVIKMPSLRPMFPTKEQKAAAALLSQATRQALYNNIAPIPVVDGFFFFPKSDRWTSTIMPRKGLSLLHYQQIWDELLDATPPMLSSAFPHGFGHAEASSSDTAQLSVTGEPPSRLATDIDSQPAGVSKASHEHWLNVRHMNAAYKLAAISLADAVVFFSKMEQPQGQSCIRWNPTTAESICLANATERVWFRKFIKEIKLCSIFQNPNFGKEYFGLRHHDAMIPDDGTALLRLYGRPVMYMWQAFKLKHIGLIQKTPNIDQSPKTRAILNGLPEVLDVIQLIWQGLWQNLLDNPSMQRTSRNFFHALDPDLQMCDLPSVIELGQSAPASEPSSEENDEGHTAPQVTAQPLLEIQNERVRQKYSYGDHGPVPSKVLPQKESKGRLPPLEEQLAWLRLSGTWPKDAGFPVQTFIGGLE